MAATAKQQINGRYGSFAEGAPLSGVPSAVQRDWVKAGVATGRPEPEVATATAPEAAVSRRSVSTHPSSSPSTPQKRKGK